MMRVGREVMEGDISKGIGERFGVTVEKES